MPFGKSFLHENEELGPSKKPTKIMLASKVGIISVHQTTSVKSNFLCQNGRHIKICSHTIIKRAVVLVAIGGSNRGV